MKEVTLWRLGATIMGAFFFFSSRRRHTRYWRDWSSDVCSSDLKLPAIRALTGSFRLSGTRSRVRVTGGIKATISQICVVTLDPFDSEVEEEVDVDRKSVV